MRRSTPGWRLLGTQLRLTRGPLLRMLGWSAIEAVPSLLSGLMVSAAVDQGFLAGRPEVGVAWLGGFGAATAVRAHAARAGFPHLAAVVEPLRDALVERVVHGALARPTADPAEVARLTEQVESARQLTATLLRTLRGVGLTLVAALVGLGLLAPAVLPLVLLPLLVAGVLFARLLGPLVDRRRAVVLAEERVAAEAGRALHGLRDVHANGAQQRVAAELAEACGASGAASRALGRAAALRSLVVALGGRAPVLAVVAAAPWLLDRGWLTAGEVLGVATYLVQQLDPAVRALAGTVGGWLLSLAVVLDRLADIPQPSHPGMDRPVYISTGSTGSSRPKYVDRSAETYSLDRSTYSASPAPVQLTAVTYAHGPHADPAFTGLDLTLASGEHLAVVGPSGTGKSTLAALLAGLLTPLHGEVRVHGVRPDTLPGPERARLVALVPQEAYLFPGTVRENLCWPAPAAGDPPDSTLTDDRIAAAVHLLGADRLVDRLGGLTAAPLAPAHPNPTPLGPAPPNPAPPNPAPPNPAPPNPAPPNPAPLDPAGLSGGERQLLALVRTYLSPAPVVVLDEATCQLDAATEERVERAFAARPGALVVVAHRISSALRADRVLLLDGGRGTVARHGDLQVLSPLYRELVGHWLGSRPGPPIVTGRSAPYAGRP